MEKHCGSQNPPRCNSALGRPVTVRFAIGSSVPSRDVDLRVACCTATLRHSLSYRCRALSVRPPPPVAARNALRHSHPVLRFCQRSAPLPLPAVRDSDMDIESLPPRLDHSCARPVDPVVFSGDRPSEGGDCSAVAAGAHSSPRRRAVLLRRLLEADHQRVPVGEPRKYTALAPPPGAGLWTNEPSLGLSGGVGSVDARGHRVVWNRLRAAFPGDPLVATN